MITLLRKTREAFKSPSVAQIVEQIHVEFDTASERLVLRAQAILAQETRDARTERLVKLGFERHPAVLGLADAAEERRRSKEQIALVGKYAEIYPQYKFILHREVIAIAKKYGLILAEVGRYIGDIPEKNLLEIEQYKPQADEARARRYNEGVLDGDWICGNPRWPFVPLAVVAPIDHFNTAGMHIVGNVLRYPDPIVLAPVVGGWLIITKWGPEAGLV